MEKTTVCLIIPTYNEEDNIPLLTEEIRIAMQKQSRSWHLLFVDDGSTDGSVEAIKKMASTYSWVHYLAFAKNCGQSAAFSAGFTEGRAEVFVTLDADLQNDPSDIPVLLDIYDNGFDMVIGWRVDRQDTVVKQYSSKIANAVRNKLSNETVKDTGCSLKVLRADMARKIPMFTGMHRFFPTLMKLQGATVAECKVNHRPRMHGISKYGVWDRAFAALYDLFAVRWMQSRFFRYSIKERK